MSDFMEFPKWIYRGSKEQPESCLVHNQGEQDLFKEDGWMPFDLFHREQPDKAIAKKKGKT